MNEPRRGEADRLLGMIQHDIAQTRDIHVAMGNVE
jgi:hypothetical protein